MRKLILLTGLLLVYALPARAQIAFDAISAGDSVTGVTTSTHAHTCTGANLVLYVVVMTADTTTGDRVVQGVTYNTVAMANVGSHDVTSFPVSGGGGSIYIWRLIAPATGANNVVVTWNGGNVARGYVRAISFTGADQTTPEDGVTAVTASNAAATSLTTAGISPTTANDWILGTMITDGSVGTITESNPDQTQTNRWSVLMASNAFKAHVSTIGPVVTPASTRFGWAWTNSRVTGDVLIVVKPATSSSRPRHRVVIQ
jgi:hypothetical protein